jgi:hypothetical protein
MCDKCGDVSARAMLILHVSNLTMSSSGRSGYNVCIHSTHPIHNERQCSRHRTACMKCIFLNCVILEAPMAATCLQAWCSGGGIVHTLCAAHLQRAAVLRRAPYVHPHCAPRPPRRPLCHQAVVFFTVAGIEAVLCSPKTNMDSYTHYRNEHMLLSCGATRALPCPPIALLAAPRTPLRVSEAPLCVNSAPFCSSARTLSGRSAPFRFGGTR